MKKSRLEVRPDRRVGRSSGLIAMLPPDKKLKLGIDLSGGTILVYEVVKENLPAELQHGRADRGAQAAGRPARGCKDIPIRKIGSNRIEIILPEASDEEVEEVKRMLTDVGSLEFRILANRKHDAAVIDRALGRGGLTKPPPRYMWARLGEVSTGTNPTFTADTITDPQQNWKKNLYAGTDVDLTGKDAAGTEQTVAVPVSRNTANTLTLAQPHGLKSITSYRIEYNPSRHPRRRPQQPPARRPDRPRGEGGPGPYRALHPLQRSTART